MPIGVLVFLIVIMAIIDLVIVFGVIFSCDNSIDGKDRLWGLFASFILCAAIFGGICWMASASNQDILSEQYYVLKNVQLENGATAQYITYGDFWNTTNKNITEELKVIYPEGSIVRAFKYKSYKNGIYWLNEDTVHYDKNVMTPSHPRYKELYDQLKK